jgi:nicotinamidase-related amidase
MGSFRGGVRTHKGSAVSARVTYSLSEACVTFSVLSAIEAGLEVYGVGDACGGLTPASYDLALRRIEAAGARITSWIQVLLELQRDWTRHATYDQAPAIVETHGGGGMESGSPTRGT